MEVFFNQRNNTNKIYKIIEYFKCNFKKLNFTVWHLKLDI